VTIPYGRQLIEEDDIAAVVEVLRGDWLTQGPHVDRFERALAERVEAAYCVAFASGTAALHAAAAAAGVGPGTRVATSPLSFVASANCGRYLGAEVGFVDVHPVTLNLDETRIGPEMDTLVAVHYAGLPVDLARLPRRPRVVIEDAAHALGAATADGPVGNCARSDLCAFSFHPVKSITTGEGGAVTTNSAELAERMRRFRNHGIQRRPERGGWVYEVTSLGYNLRLTDLAAALGLSQLGKLDRFVRRREELAGRYGELLAGLPLTLPAAAPPGWRHARHLYPVRLPAGARAAVFAAMRAAGIGVQVHYVPIYRHPLWAAAGPPERFGATEAAYAGLLSLPLHQGLTEAEQDRVVASLAEALAGTGAGVHA
jgi:UDP-4-amino-4,6-dideoxy-N-acetyl-beta-L-altrosamine transaminase